MHEASPWGNINIIIPPYFHWAWTLTFTPQGCMAGEHVWTGQRVQPAGKTAPDCTCMCVCEHECVSNTLISVVLSKQPSRGCFFFCVCFFFFRSLLQGFAAHPLGLCVCWSSAVPTGQRRKSQALGASGQVWIRYGSCLWDWRDGWLRVYSSPSLKRTLHFNTEKKKRRAPIPHGPPDIKQTIINKTHYSKASNQWLN